MYDLPLADEARIADQELQEGSGTVAMGIDDARGDSEIRERSEQVFQVKRFAEVRRANEVQVRREVVFRVDVVQFARVLTTAEEELPFQVRAEMLYRFII